MVAIVVGAGIMVGAYGILLSSRLAAWVHLGAFIPLMDVACILLLRAHAPSNRYFFPAAV